jgi:hypothetical protein
VHAEFCGPAKLDVTVNQSTNLQVGVCMSKVHMQHPPVKKGRLRSTRLGLLSPVLRGLLRRDVRDGGMAAYAANQLPGALQVVPLQAPLEQSDPQLALSRSS